MGMITWQRIGCIEVAQLPDGGTAVVRDAHAATSDPVFVQVFNSKGRVIWDRWRPHVSTAKREIAEKYALKPFDAGPDYSLWKSADKTRTAFVYLNGRGDWWVVFCSDDRSASRSSRGQAEAVAAKYVSRGEE